MDTQQPIKPPSSRYWNAREAIRASPLMNRQLSLFDVMRIGKSLYTRRDSLALYGMNPIAWYFSGIRIVGRTALEAHPDRAAAEISETTADVFSQSGYAATDLIDPFLGSGNLAYHLARRLFPKRIVGCEINSAISSRAQKALQILRKQGRIGADLVVLNDDWTRATEHVRSVPTLVVLAPPWGAAYKNTALDLRETSPPIPELINRFMLSRATDLFFLIPIARATLTEPITSAPRLETLIHYKKGSRSFLLFRAARPSTRR